MAFVFNEDEFDGAGGSGTLNIISGVPTGGTTTAVPEPSSLALIMVLVGSWLPDDNGFQCSGPPGDLSSWTLVRLSHCFYSSGIRRISRFES